MSKLTSTFGLKIRKMEDELYLDCECHAEVIKLNYWKEDGDFSVTVFSYAPKSLSLVERIKYLFCGQSTSTDVILSEYNASKLANFITNNIKNG